MNYMVMPTTRAPALSYILVDPFLAIAVYLVCLTHVW